MLSDSEILLRNYQKYRDKTGKKAQRLKERIEQFKAFEKLVKRIQEYGVNDNEIL